MVPITHYLILSVVLFCIGMWGVFTRKNAIVMFMCIELMLNAANLAFIAFSFCSIASATGSPFAFSRGRKTSHFILNSRSAFANYDKCPPTSLPLRAREPTACPTVFVSFPRSPLPVNRIVLWRP